MSMHVVLYDCGQHYMYAQEIRTTACRCTVGEYRMTKHIGLTLRIGAAYDEVRVNQSGAVSVFDRSGMVGLQKKSLARDVQRVRRHNASVAG